MFYLFEWNDATRSMMGEPVQHEGFLLARQTFTHVGLSSQTFDSFDEAHRLALVFGWRDYAMISGDDRCMYSYYVRTGWDDNKGYKGFKLHCIYGFSGFSGPSGPGVFSGFSGLACS